ncbi:MAG: HAD-IIIA family hydrolase [Candidatus Nanoarchaeia archaeon]
MRTLICIDRDGVLIYDEKFYLGRTDGWKKKVSLLPTVVEGIKLLRRISAVSVYMITNQPGVAIKDFPELTLERAHEVCAFVMEMLADEGAELDGYYLCAHADPGYAERHGEYEFEKSLVCECECIKPRLGMVFDALKREGLTRENTKVFIIGDRASDMQTALNVQGKGILVPFEGEPGQIEKVRRMEGILIAKDFKEAAGWIRELSLDEDR